MRRLSILALYLLLSGSPQLALAQNNAPPDHLPQSVHASIDCMACHSGETAVGSSMPAVNCGTCHSDVAAKYDKSIHGRLHNQGVNYAAYCSNCHGTHNILPLSNERSSIHKKQVATTCGQCHPNVLVEYEQSIHGVAVAKGIPDAPTCTDCHGEHDILPAIEKLSRVYPATIAKTTCPQCHESERIIAKYNLSRDRVKTYKETYHGMASDIGDTHVANCASCHGVHNIRASSDPDSLIHPSHLTQTCGACHPNADEHFIQGSVHGYTSDDFPSKLINAVRMGYIFLIFIVVGGYILHNGLDFWRKLKKVFAQRLKEQSIIRMGRQERIQHGVLVFSFFMLVISGFALKFGWGFPFLPDQFNELLRGILHRICGVLLIGVFLYHLVYVATKPAGRRMVLELLPALRDFKEALHYVAYLLGRRPDKPRFGFFTYWEKMEYWSVIWGTIVMAVTGLILWFESSYLNFFPKWTYDLASLVHYLEAILATLAILIGHLYFVFANPDVQPMSFTWLTGRMPRHLAEEEHPDAYLPKISEEDKSEDDTLH